MKKEIGSEFDYKEFSALNVQLIPSWLKLGNDNLLLYSGRTAIDFILKDISYLKKVRSVYLPSYCCESIIIPFVENKLEILYYNVCFANSINYEIDYDREIDIFFSINYFGFYDNKMIDIINRYKNKGVIVIEDITHNIFSDVSYSKNSDYLIASLTKCLPILSCGYASKMSGHFNKIKLNYPDEKFINYKKEAMINKNFYLNQNTSDKNLKKLFLWQFSKFNNSLDSYYKNLKVDRFSNYIINIIDYKNIKSKRFENFIFLDNNIQLGSIIKFKKNREGNCPMFFPILIENKYRDKLHNYLISNDIFCPIHWPKSSFILNNYSDHIYNSIVSIVCDQRYDLNDMKKIVSILKKIDLEINNG